MKVKNIKSFIEFYKAFEISDSIASTPRFELLKKKGKKNIVHDQNISKQTTIKLGINEKLENLKNDIKKLDCDLKDIATNLVFSDGNHNSKIMLIGEAPGAEEDKIGKPFVGQAGQLLDKMFAFINLNRKKDFYITNIVFWRPPGNRTPTSQEIKLCLPYTIRHIKIIKPKILILLGNIATKSILKINEGITKVRGREHFFEEEGLNIPARAIFHPAYLMRNPIEKKKVWEDLIDVYTVLKKRNIH